MRATLTGHPSGMFQPDGWGKLSAIRDSGGTATAEKPGTYNLTGSLDGRLQACRADEIGERRRHRHYVPLRDSNNYYRFSMDATQSVRRLIRIWAGVVTVLWEDAIAYVPGRRYLATVDCVGHRITVYLNGIELLSVENGAHAFGQLRCIAGTTGRLQFNELRVTPAVWMTYYQFGAEDRRSAGRRIRILSGNFSDAPAATPLEERRFRFRRWTTGGARNWPARQAPMRLVTPFPIAAHNRTFWTDRCSRRCPSRCCANPMGWVSSCSRRPPWLPEHN